LELYLVLVCLLKTQYNLNQIFPKYPIDRMMVQNPIWDLMHVEI